MSEDLKARLLAVRLPQDTVDIEGVGTVTVRGLSRAEMMHAGKLTDTQGHLASERYVLSCCMLDPTMTEHEVAMWQKVSRAAEINPVTEAINRLSGIGGEKEAYKSLRGEPNPGIRVLPVNEAGHDGSGPEGADVG